MTMVNHSRFLHYVLLLVFKIDHIVSVAESVPILTWIGEKALTLVKKNEIFLLQYGVVNKV
jgi:hypothetical protein